MIKGDNVASPCYQPLRTLHLIPLTGVIKEKVTFDEPLWCPYSFPDNDGYKIYWECVKGISFWGHQVPSDLSLSNLDRFIPLVAHMLCEHEFSDELLAPMVPRLFGGLVHTIQTMPDICVIVFYLGFWTKKISPYFHDWAVLLTKATPLPCKARNLENSFSEAVKSPEVYDFLIRVILGCFLGLYGGRKAPFWTRVWCYAAFVVYPPSVKQFQKFILKNKGVITICVETFILFSLKQTPFDDYLRKKYQWSTIYENRFKAMEALQEHVYNIGNGKDFLTKRSNWAGLDDKLQAFSVEFKKYCFRPIVQPFGDRVIEQAYKVWRKNSSARCHAGLLSIPLEYFEYVWSIPLDVYNQRHFDAFLSMLPSHLFSSDVIQRWNKAKYEYYMEQNVTGPQHLMAGTEKKKTGLYYSDSQTFFDLMSYCLVFTHRLKLRWGLLPRTWALNQSDALSKLLGDALHADSGCYYICPNCSKVRTKPVNYPDGQFKNKRERARYCHDVRVDFNTMVAYCKDYSPRRKKQILKRRKRKNRQDEDYENGDNIKVCTQTPLIRVCMVGIMLYTEQDGNLVLCVDCGTMISWTPQCITERGPTCGCMLKHQDIPLRDAGSCASCDRVFSHRSRVRTHDVLNEVSGQIETIKVCRGHHTNWEHRLQYLFPKSLLLRAIRNHQYAYLYNGTPIFRDSS